MFAKSGIGIAGAVIPGAQPAGTAAVVDNVTLKAGIFLPSVDRIRFPHIRTRIKRANEAGGAHGLKVKMVAAGVKAIVLEGAKRKKFPETATPAGRADVMKTDPVNGPKIRKLTELR